MRATIFAVALATLATGSAHAALVVSKSPTSNVDCGGGMCVATAADAVLNVKDLKTQLKAADLIIVSGSAAQDIVIDAKFSWMSAHRLNLDAYRSVTVLLGVTSEGHGGATITTNDGGSGGNLTFSGKGRLSFWDNGSSLLINGASYALVGDLTTLAADIAAKPTHNYALSRMVDASLDGTYAASPITTTFGGTLEGLGHSITKLRIAYDDKDTGIDMGLFLLLGGRSTVRNLTLANANIQMRSNDRLRHYIGAFAATSHGKLRNLQVLSGVVSASGCAGGLVGFSDGEIAGSVVTGGSVGGGQGVGGAVCVNNGIVTATGSSAGVSSAPITFAGGLVGFNDQHGSIALSWSNGMVIGGGGKKASDGAAYSAGFVALNSGAVDQSWASGSVDGGEGVAGQDHESDVYAGGFVAENIGRITNSYSSNPSVEATLYAYVGGFAAQGASGDKIDTSYSIAHTVCNECNFASPFIAKGCPTGNDNYYDSDLPAGRRARDCSGVTGLTTAEFLSGLPTGFDPAIWAEDSGINGGYPYLIADPPG